MQRNTGQLNNMTRMAVLHSSCISNLIVNRQGQFLRRPIVQTVM